VVAVRVVAADVMSVASKSGGNVRHSRTKCGWEGAIMANANSVELYKRADGKWAWRIIARRGNLPDEIIATDGNQGYENKADALHGLFSVFFGTYDTSFLEVHKLWSESGSEETPEAYVRQAPADCELGQPVDDGEQAEH
jgi:uncharacterized protein YegP (UPF0339 family)